MQRTVNTYFLKKAIGPAIELEKSLDSWFNWEKVFQTLRGTDESNKHTGEKQQEFAGDTWDFFQKISEQLHKTDETGLLYCCLSKSKSAGNGELSVQ